ncbi:MAG: hypothetical protein L0G49_12215 [Luteococcus sp.]|nr:hypothetical protein [Luteococcus sp.]
MLGHSMSGIMLVGGTAMALGALSVLRVREGRWPRVFRPPPLARDPVN